MRMKMKFKRLLSLLLALLMFMVTMPTAVFAEEVNTDTSVAEDSPAEEDAVAEAEEPSAEALTLKDHLETYGFAYVQLSQRARVFSNSGLTDEGHIYTLTSPGDVLLVTEYNGFSVKIWFYVGSDAAMRGYATPDAISDSVLTDAELESLTNGVESREFTTDAGCLPLYSVDGEFAVTEEPTTEDTTQVTTQDDTQDLPDAELETTPDTNTVTEEETDHDDGAETPVDPAVDAASEEEAAADDAPQELADDAAPEADTSDEAEVIIKRNTRSVTTPTRFTGEEDVRLGKEGGNIYNIIVQKNGSESTSIARHWVTVDGVKYTAFCIEASKSSTSGRDGGLQPGTDAGLLWILSNVPDSTDEEYVIKQQAVWAYLGQSFSISGLAAGSRCSLSTDQLRERLTEIVSSAQNASLTGDKELWIAYHLENRNTYQDMAFIVDEPDPIPGAIRIMKLDSATGTVLAGATFELLHGSTVIATATTGADGVVTFTDIMPGTYTVRESSAPEGYILGEVTVQTVTVSDGQTVTATFVNDKSSSRVKIIKVDAQTGAPLTGASFTITRLSGPAVISGIAIGESITLVTDENGEIETDWLEWGQYRIEETAAPNGYINSGFSEIIEAYEDEAIYAFSVENELMQGGIQIIKTDADTGAALSGATFEVVNSAGAVVGTATTNADGVACFTDLLVDTYIIRETGAPTGYTLSTPNEQTLTVAAGQTAYATFANEKISGKIAIYKVDADSKEPLAGAAFTVTDANGNVVSTLVTDANGTAETDLLPYGTYTVTETAAPDHYINSGVSVNISITEHGKTYTIEAENEPMTGGLIVRKKDAVTGFAISGVQFDIYLGDDLVATMTTDANGVATCTGLDAGTYTVKEHALPTGYVGELAVLEGTVTSDVTTVLDVTNMPSQSKIQIIKTDSVTGEKLSGAEFSIANAAGIVIGQLITGEDGTTTSGWLPYGVYTITETKAPDTFINRGFSTRIEAYENGKTYIIEVENEPTKGGIKVIKTNSLTQLPIAGVQFDVYQGSVLVGTMTTNEQGVAFIEDLEKGDYIVREHALPTGYVGELAEMTAVVESEKITELAATNTPSRSRVRIVKTDALSGDVLAGAEFTVTDASGNVIEVLTTGADGTAESGWLIYGSYTITETAAPEHYLNGGFFQTIDAFEDGKTYEFTVTNQPTEGGIRLMKTDALSGKPIAGVEFHVYSGSTLVGTMITDVNGVASINDLEPGSYTVKEAALPTGYTGELVELEAVVQSDVTCELTATNTPSRSKVRIVKTDALSGGVLAGAEFTVTDAFGNVIEVLTTGADGTAESDWLIYGSYTITETAAPDHYINGGFTQTIDAFEDGKTYEFTVTNQPTEGGIRLMKTDALSGKPIAGVEFHVYSGTTLIGTMITDANGVATINDLEPGSYTVKEVALPTGYTGELVELEAVVQSDVTCELTATNTPSRSKVRIIKTDALTGDALAGAEFTIMDALGNVVEVLTTGENGTAESDWLIYGSYTITETAAPDHYINGGFTQTIDAFEDGKTYEFAVSNAPTKGGIRLIKTDSETGAPIEGVKFNIFHGDTLIATMTTDENGVATCDNLDKGTYIVKEDTLPEGYTGELVVLEAVVQSDAVTELHAVNCKSKSRIRIIKTDALTGEAVSGAEFTVTDEVGNVFSIITGENGEVTTDWLPYGVYTVTETKTPEHYVTSDWSETVAAHENGVTYTCEVSNTPTKGYLQITKTDALDGMLIEGVQFDIYQDDELVSTMTTGADGVATSDALPKGTYTVKEHGLPEGYTGELATMEAVVKSDETTQLSAVNHPIMGMIRIEKSDALTGEALAGAEFTITRSTGLPSHKGSNDGEVVAVITTDETGVAVSPLLTWGTYTVVETKIPEHYENQPFEAVVTISEHEQTYTVEAENVPTMGYIRVTKTNSLDQTPIEGVVFDISQNSQVITSMTTGADGIAVSDPLPKGTYTVSERDTPIGYVYEIVNLKVEVKSDETTELTVTNKPIEGKFRIEKRDSLTGDRLAGAIFTVTRVSGLPSHNGSNDGEVVATVATDINGVAETPWLTYGVYRVEETGVPEHYVDNSFSVEAVINEEDMGTYLVDCENEPTKGWIQLVKVDALDRTPIAGVVFDIFRNGEVVSSMNTNEDGVALSEPLHKGEYQVWERDNPTGYTDELIVLDAVVKSDETTHLSCTNQPIQGRIQIQKTDELTKGALAGAEFTVTRVSGLPSHNGSNDGEVVAVITTDANGMAITPLLTWGTYRIEETGVPEHYVDNSFCVDVTISEDQKIYTVDVENEPTKGWIRLTKTDRLNGNPIEGVQFDIYYADEYGEGLAGTMVTDANGIAMSEPLRKGQYIVREHGETPGYVFEKIELVATVKSDEITDVAATNMPVLVQLTIYKRDIDEYDGDDPNTNPRNKAIPTMPDDYDIPDPATRGDGMLTGTVFQVSAGADIVDRQGNVIYPEGTVIIESLTTAGDAASVTTEPLWPGLYAVQEIKAPTGYQIDPNPFYVDSRGAAMQSTVPTVTFSGLSRNEILYGAQAIVKVLGNNDNTTDPTRVEIPEVGAEFRVFLKSAGSYENARDFERDYLTTDENGYAMTKPLPYGVYVLEQTAGKDGYEIKGPIEFEIDGTENLDNPPPLTLSDKPILYRLKLIKTDADTGKVITLANTSFKIKDSKGEYITQTVYYPREMEIDTFTTDETGSVTLPEVVNWGHYFIEEIVAPEGYLIRTDELAVFIGNAGDTPGETYEVEIEIPNEAVIGRIELVKTGLTLTGFMTCRENGYEVTRPIYEDRYLAGATFEIRAAENIIGGDGTLWYTKDALVETITTSGTGSDMSKELPLGRYYLIETGAPVGYILEDVPYEADLTYLDGHTPVVTIQVRAGNKYLPASVALVKHKEVTEVLTSDNDMVHQVITTAPGEGFTFGLYNAKDIHYANGTLMADTLMAVGVTDEQGLLHISGYFPHGEYYIKELAAPDGWKINPNLFPVSILPDMVAEDAAMIEVVYPEAVYDELIYTPITLTKTDITGAEPVPGALIELKDENGTVIYRAITDANGEIPDIPVVPGTYTFREVLAPEGYELNTAEMTFTVDELGNITGDTVIRDDYTRVFLLKRDMQGEPLANVEFGLFNADGSLQMTAVSDAEGHVIFERIPFGSYTIRETKALPGYLLNDTVVHLTVDGTFVNPTEPLAVIENHPIEVILHKIDKDNKPLPGAIFGLFDSDGFLCMTALSDATGTVKFQYVPYGSYTIREIEAPDGYLLSQTVIPVEIDAAYHNSVEPLATVVNQAARLQYKKVDTSGKLLPGVEFSLINADSGEVVEVVTSDDAGEFVFTRFTYGNWVVRETKAPEGYNVMPDIELKVDENWVEPEPFTLVNIPNHYEFVKIDNKGNPMPGVKFTLEDGAGNILRDLVSGEDGIVHVTDLTPGVYIIREIETLEGYTLSEETIKVVIDEQYVVPDEMFRFVNYPNIQTGAGFEMTSLMWSGVALVITSCAAVMVFLLLNKRRPRT